jgi:hypothetical protein
MQGKRLLAIIGGLAALSLSASTLAIMSVPSGWYLEGNAGSAHLSNRSYGHGNSSTQSGLGGNVNLGYKFMPYFGLEIGYSQYPNANVKNAAGSKVARDKHYSYDLAGKGIVPIADSGAELFAKLGIQRINSHVSSTNASAASSAGVGSGHHSATGLYLGIGGQYYFMPELAVVVQWQGAQGNNKTGNENLFSGGLSFIFD